MWTALIISFFVMLILPVVRDWYRFYHVSKFTRPGDTVIPTFAVYSLPSPIFWTFTGVIFVLIHAFGDCPLRSGAVMCALLTALASTEGFLPDRDRPDEAKQARAAKPEHHHHHHHHEEEG